MSSKGPNFLNLNAYIDQKQGQQDDHEVHQVDNQSIEDQFDSVVKDIQKYDNVLKKIQKDVQNVMVEDKFITDFYPPFITELDYEEDDQKRIICNTDPQLTKVMTSLEKNNKILKDQLRGWIFQFAKKTKLSEVLISENKILRKSICGKNKEIVKLIEGIQKAENQDIIELKESLDNLKEQNGVLLDHLNSIRQAVKDQKEEERQLQNLHNQSRLEFTEIKKRTNEAQDEEEHFSKMVTLIEESLDQILKRKKKMERKKKDLQKLKEEYSKDRNSLRKQIEICENEKEQIDSNLKTKLQHHRQESNKLIDEINEWTDKIIKQKQMTEYYQSEINRNTRRIDQYTNSQKQQQKKLKEYKERCEKFQKDIDQQLEKETEINSEVDLLNYETVLLKNQLEEQQRKQKNVREKHKREIRNLEEDNAKEQAEWQTHLKKINREMAKKVLQEKSQLSIKEKEIQKWQEKIDDKKQQMNDLKLQMKEIKDNHTKMAQLRSQLRQQQKRKGIIT